MKKIKTCLLLLTLLVSLTSCSNKGGNTINNDIYTYKQFQSIYQNMIDKLSFNHYKKLEDTKETNFVFIDKKMSLGKRELLTLDGKQNHTETQERIVYKSKDNTKILMIDMIYLKKSLDDDMVYINFFPTDLKERESLLLYDDLLLSKNNLLFQMTLISTNGKSLSLKESYDINVQLVDYIKEIKKP